MMMALESIPSALGPIFTGIQQTPAKTTHTPSNLPELPVNEEFSLDGMYTRMVGAKFFTTKQHFHCHASNLIPNDDKPNRNVKLSSDMFHVGETLLYMNAGQNLYV